MGLWFRAQLLQTSGLGCRDFCNERLLVLWLPPTPMIKTPKKLSYDFKNFLYVNRYQSGLLKA